MKVITVRKRCPNGDGEMISTGIGFSNNLGPAWQNRCNKCGHTEMYPKGYPYSYYQFLPKELEERWEGVGNE